ASGVWQLPLNLAAIGIPQLLFLGFALAFAIKMPLFPLHTWLPAAYTASPIPVVIVLAGLVSKLGAYGFLRFNLALFPDAAHSLGPLLAVLAVIGILYGAFMALVQTDLKRLVAYASMSHLGFIGLGIFAGNLLGIEGSLVQMINHGVIIAALFLVVGMIERRAGTRDRAQLRGLGATAPLFAAIFLVVSLAALGLPGLNGFVGEFLIMLGAWTAFVPLAVAAGIGVLFLDLLLPVARRRWLPAVTVVGLLAALIASLPLWGQNRAAFADTVVADSLAAFFNVLLIVITILTVLISPRFLRALDLDHGEYYILLLGATAGMMLLAAATSLMTIFLGI